MTTRTIWTIAALSGTCIVISCTQSYDDYLFTDTPPATGTPTATASGTATGTGTAGTAGGGATASGTGGAGTGTGAGVGGAGAAGGPSTGGGGGSTVGMTVLCDGTPCDVSSGGYCCRPRYGGNQSTCEPSGDGCDATYTTIRCDGPEDCPGQVCCGQYTAGSYAAITCVDDCSGYGAYTFCDPTAADPCPDSDTCQESQVLSGYYVCR